MPGSQRQGLGGLLEVLSEEVLRGRTGALDIAGVGVLYLVFGHPLHAVMGDLTGLAAVDGIGAVIRERPDIEVAWLPGRTAGRVHTLSPSDGVLERLRGDPLDQFGPGRAAELDVVGDLNLRRMISEQPAEANVPPLTIRDPRWVAVVDEVCISIDAALHLHARTLTEIISAAPADPSAILMAIDRARSVPVRAVSRSVVSALLNDAEALVKERARLG